MGTVDAVRGPGAPGFSRHVLRDLRALERMIAAGMLEREPRRVGAEQEVVLVDAGGRPVPVAPAVLQRLDRARFTPEIALFNAEINVPPVPCGPDLLRTLHTRLDALLAELREAADSAGAQPVLTGILPSLAQSDLTPDRLSPFERYRLLNDAVLALAGGQLTLHVEGVDELRVAHDSVMLEACNTSFQVHLQTAPEEFAAHYNAAQLALGPLLAVACNSPFLFGKRLWSETRIAVFHQSIDAAASPSLREMPPRVRFGERWVRHGAVELFEQDVTRFRPLLTREPAEDPLGVLDAGGIPRLDCLQLHNSTVYRWNRPCYGITDGRPHLRIECRAIPSGPTVLDEIANAAFWLGLTCGLVRRHGDVGRLVAFADAKANFLAAARRGLHCGLVWLTGDTVDARTLAADLLETADEGLAVLGADADDRSRYLGIIRERVRTRRTGAWWLEQSAAAIETSGSSRPEKWAALTCAILRRQWEGRPVHEWELAAPAEGRGRTAPTVAQYMTTTLFTLQQTEPVELAAFIMDRERIRHIPVEDAEHRLVGLVSYRALLRLLARNPTPDLGAMPVSEVMVRSPVTVEPGTTAGEAGRLMRQRGIACLPVVANGRLVGILSERDFMPLAADLLDERFPA